MSFVTSDHEEFRNAVRRFTEEEIVPIASELDAKNAEIPMEIIAIISIGISAFLASSSDAIGTISSSVNLLTAFLNSSWSLVTKDIIIHPPGKILFQFKIGVKLHLNYTLQKLNIKSKKTFIYWKKIYIISIKN